MYNEQTVNTMQSMKLFGMARGFQERLGSPQHSELSHAEFVGLLVDDEKTHRENLRLKRLIRNAKFKQQAALEGIDYKHPRGLTKQAIAEVSNSQWIAAHRNILITGPTGVGKTYLACAFGNLAARAGFTALYVRAPRMFEILQQSKGDGSHLKTIEKFGKVQLLIIDDLLLTPLSDPERRDLMEIIEDRYSAVSTVIASQCPTKDWHQNIGDPTIADAICDRLLHNAYKIALKGDTIRPEEEKRKAS
jgi:DNA replication protein DnaC